MPLVTCGADGSTNAEVVEQINKNTTENVFNVDSMTDLLSIDFTIYKTTNIRGYYNSNDGGGDLFSYDSTVDKSTANAGTIIDPSVSLANQGTGIGTGCWIRQYNGYVHTRMFGAKGDGSLESPMAMQKAFDSLSIGDSIYIDGFNLLSGKLTFNIRGVNIIGTNTSSINGESIIELDSTATDDELIDIQEDAISFNNVALIGKGKAVSNSKIFTSARTDNIPDIDVAFNNCIMYDVETIGELTGRGMLIDNCMLSTFIEGIVLNWPDTLIEGANPDQKKASGFRSIRFSNNRVHAGSSGYLFWNTNTNHELIWGVHITDNYIDTRVGMWRGSLIDAVISGNNHFNNDTTPFLIQTGFIVKDVTINGNSFNGMSDNGLGGTYEFGSFISADVVTNLTVSSNVVKRTVSHTISFQANSKNIIIIGNDFKDVLIGHRNPTVRNVLYMPSSLIDNVTFSNNIITASSEAIAVVVAGDVLVSSGSVNIANFIAYGNQYSDQFKLDNIVPTAASRQTLATNIYDGDGLAEQVIDLDFYPSMVLVNNVANGDTRLQLYGTSSGTTEVELRNGSVAVKGIYNTAATRYMLMAFR